MAKRAKRKKWTPFEGSSIIPQKIPPHFKKSKATAFRRISTSAVTRSGKDYSEEMRILGSLIYPRVAERKRRATIIAFARNYYVTHQELPNIEQLQQVFPYLKREKKATKGKRKPKKQ